MRDHEVRVQEPGERFPRERELAWRLAEVAADPVPVEPEVAEQAANRVLDDVAVAVAALDRDPPAAARAQALAHPCPGGATVLGLGPGTRVAAEWAAWANGTAVRELDFHSHKIDHVAHLGPSVAAGLGTLLGLPVEVTYQAVNQALHVTTATRQSRKGAISSWRAFAPAHAGKPFGVGKRDQLAYYSNYGGRVDVAAPGGARKFNLPAGDRGSTPGFPVTADDLTNAWQTFSTTSNWRWRSPASPSPKGPGSRRASATRPSRGHRWRRRTRPRRWR
jgi:hypothetical protein